MFLLELKRVWATKLVIQILLEIIKHLLVLILAFQIEELQIIIHLYEHILDIKKDISKIYGLIRIIQENFGDIAEIGVDEIVSVWCITEIHLFL